MTRFDPLWNALDQTVSSGWAPGLVAGVKYQGQDEFYATGTLATDSTNPMQLDTRFRIASLSKPFAGVLALQMIADGVFALDDPVETWLPEIANPRVLIDPAGDLDQTTAAVRPITIRHLLTFTNGIGLIFEPTPLNQAIYGGGIGAGAVPPQVTADEYMRVIGDLPLEYQPGEMWKYNTGADLLSILLARASGKSLIALLKERILDPLGMNNTSFWSDGADLPVQYAATESGLEPFTQSIEAFAKPPLLETLAGGLVSTVPDYMRFLTALADDTLLSPEMGEQMTTNQITPAQMPGLLQLGGPGAGWGYMIGVETGLAKPWSAIGRWGWTGGSGTSAAADPSRLLVGIVFTQRLMSGPHDDFGYFWQPLVDAID